MNEKVNRGTDWYRIGRKNSVHHAVTPRALLVEPDGYTLLFRHDGWFGMPGGRTTLDERRSAVGKYISDPAAYEPTIVRHTRKQTGVDITPFIKLRAYLTGYAATTYVDTTRHSILYARTPVIVCHIPANLPFRGNAVRIPPGHVPARAYPDAAMAMIRRIIEPDFGPFSEDEVSPSLNDWGKVVFRLHPKPGYLIGDPPLGQYGLKFKAPLIPRSLPPHNQSWLRRQYQKM